MVNTNFSVIIIFSDHKFCILIYFFNYIFSLNRKSPQMNDLVVSENEDTSQLIASGGTEGSFMSAASQNSHAARFCHECGSKYPVLAAKFCCHCGVRRLVI